MKKDAIGAAITMLEGYDPVAHREEYCLCTSCKNLDICKYYSKFVRFQQANFPAKVDCYKYERQVEE